MTTRATTAAVLREQRGALSLETVEVALPTAGEVLVRMAGVGICHTDLGVIAAPADGQLPIVLGHEGSGTVEAVGEGVTAVKVGDRVALSYASCGTCDICRRGLPMHCREFIARNLTGTRIDGTSPLTADGQSVLGAWFGQSSWSGLSITNERNCVVVDDDVPLELVGPLGCGIQTGAGAVLNTLKPEPGSSTAVFAVGSVGLAAILAAQTVDCATIIAVDIDDARLSRAEELGATHTVNSSKVDAAQAIIDITDGRGAQYSVDCIGLPDAVRSALECLQTPGVCASVGFQGLPNQLTIDQGHLLFGRSLVGVIEGDAVPQEFVPRMLDLYRQGRFPFDELITTYPFEAINEALDDAHHAKVTKAVLTFT